jgi:hypothetical protein
MLQKQGEWVQAQRPDRAVARQRFINALHDFNALVLDHLEDFVVLLAEYQQPFVAVERF